MALWKLFSMDVLVGNWNESITNFNEIQSAIEALKINLEEEFKKTSSDSVKKFILKNLFKQNRLTNYKLTLNTSCCIEATWCTGRYSS